MRGRWRKNTAGWDHKWLGGVTSGCNISGWSGSCCDWSGSIVLGVWISAELPCVYTYVLLIICRPSSNLCTSQLVRDLTEHNYCVSQEVSILVHHHPHLMRPALMPLNMAFTPLLILLWLYFGCPWCTQAPSTFQVPHSCPFFSMSEFLAPCPSPKLVATSYQLSAIVYSIS